MAEQVGLTAEEFSPEHGERLKELSGKMLRMRGKLLFFASLLLATVSFAAAVAQSTPGANRPPYDGSDSQDGPRPIHVDQSCRILPNSAPILPKQKPHPYRDDTVCYQESERDSTHWEEQASGHELRRTFVYVREHEFVLQDVTDQPVMFFVEQTVPRGYFVDSDPQPWKVAGITAYFHVYVKPGETVRLHVGMRHEFPGKPKPI